MSEVTFSLLNASPPFTPGSSELVEIWYQQDGTQRGVTGDANSDHPCYSYHSHRRDLEMSGKWEELRGGLLPQSQVPHSTGYRSTSTFLQKENITAIIHEGKVQGRNFSSLGQMEEEESSEKKSLVK